MKAKLIKAAGMIPKPPENVAIIRDSQSLQAFAGRMAERAWIAIDTEFLRERTYYPKLCLVQIADDQEIGLVDVLAIEDLEPLAALLRNAQLLKVFHSAEQDLEVLSQRFGHVPAPLFDTQLAAPLLGFDDQMGYARLIQALLDVELAKAHTRTDWSKRPLPAGALDYAADDVRYLAVAYAVLRDTLAANERLDWLTPDLEQLAAPQRFAVDTRLAWRRLRGWHRLRPAEQQVLAELAGWREGEAMTTDRPRKWILGDDALTAIAKRQPADENSLRAISELPEKTAQRHGPALLDCVRRGQAHPAVALAERGGPPDAREKKQIKTGMHQLAERAEALDIAAATLASRQEIAAIVAGERDTRLLRGWRAEVAGNAVLAAIEAAQADERA